MASRGGRYSKSRNTKGTKMKTTSAKKSGSAREEQSNLCEVVVSPSKELVEAEQKLKKLRQENGTQNNGCGGWPKSATRKS